jgi:cell division protein FtsB
VISRALTAVAAGLGLALVVYGGSSAVRVWRLQRQVVTMERELGALRDQQAELARAVDRLRSDPETIEQRAREDLGKVRPGEIILRFPSTPGGR